MALPVLPRLSRFQVTILFAWLLASLVLLAFSSHDIAGQVYPDPDDVLRRLEVRDWLAGQSWWDVSQHRLASGMMHWSRLVDLPLAAVIAPLSPLLGEVMAERVAMAIVPLVTLGWCMALVALITRRLSDEGRARLSLIITPMAIPLLIQARPMRIDHHGWQVVLALAATYAFTGAPTRRSGIWGGLAIAVLLTISLEGLPVAACLLTLLALAWALQPTRADQLEGASWAAFLAAVVLHAATRGPFFWVRACDAMAPCWLAVLGTAAVVLSIAIRLGVRSLPGRIALLAIGASCCAAALVLTDATCLAGPFGHLDPLVRQIWYEHVNEGLPIWQQTLAWAVVSIGLPVVGLWGTITALRAGEGGRHGAWWYMLGVQIATLVTAVLVTRASATANALAVPGAAYWAMNALHRARAIGPTLPRLAATLGAFAIAIPNLVMVPFVLLVTSDTASAAHHRVGVFALCKSGDDLRGLAQLPPSRLFAPIDIAPEIVAATDHGAIASGHHRNAAAMRDVMLAYTGSEARARAIIADQYHARYLVACPGFPELGIYRKFAPNGLWARLERGERFAWLQPVPIKGSHVLAWRVLPNGANRS